MIGFLKRLRKNQRGNVLIITAAAMPMLVGMAGLATDTIQWALWKRQLQRAADSAAIAGVYERNVTGGETTTVEAAVLRDLTLNQHAGTLDGTPIVGFPADQASPDKRVNQVSVTLRVKKALTFSSFFLDEAPSIEVRSTAASVPGAGEYCVIALDDRDVVGADIGGSTTVDLGDCCMIANAKHNNEAFKNTGNASTVKAGCIAAAGGVQFSESGNWDVDNYYPYSEPASDPFEDLPTPTAADCDPVIRLSLGPQVNDDTDFSTEAAGHAGKTICIDGGFDIKADLTLGAATYVINTSGANDDLKMTENGASLNCNGCTIIMTNFANRTATGNVRLTGGTVNIMAPDATAVGNPYMGVVLYQDRLAADDNKRGTNHVNGNNTSGVRGVIYMPSRSLLYNGSGTIDEQQCMQLVARRIEFTGNSAFKMGSLCGYAGMHGHTGGGWLVRLVA